MDPGLLFVAGTIAVVLVERGVHAFAPAFAARLAFVPLARARLAAPQRGVVVRATGYRERRHDVPGGGPLAGPVTLVDRHGVRVVVDRSGSSAVVVAPVSRSRRSGTTLHLEARAGEAGLELRARWLPSGTFAVLAWMAVGLVALLGAGVPWSALFAIVSIAGLGVGIVGLSARVVGGPTWREPPDRALAAAAHLLEAHLARTAEREGSVDPQRVVRIRVPPGDLDTGQTRTSAQRGGAKAAGVERTDEKGS